MYCNRTFIPSVGDHMRGNTVVMLVIALVFGAVAVFFANIWLNSQSSRQSQVAQHAFYG